MAWHVHSLQHIADVVVNFWLLIWGLQGKTSDIDSREGASWDVSASTIRDYRPTAAADQDLIQVGVLSLCEYAQAHRCVFHHMCDYPKGCFCFHQNTCKHFDHPYYQRIQYQFAAWPGTGLFRLLELSRCPIRILKGTTYFSNHMGHCLGILCHRHG